MAMGPPSVRFRHSAPTSSPIVNRKGAVERIPFILDRIHVFLHGFKTTLWIL
jgi:hypothetical protein